MPIVFWLFLALGTLTLTFGWLLAQAPARTHALDISVWFCALVLLTVAFLILVRKKRAIADPWLLVFIGAELSLCGYDLLSFV